MGLYNIQSCFIMAHTETILYQKVECSSCLDLVSEWVKTFRSKGLKVFFLLITFFLATLTTHNYTLWLPKGQKRRIDWLIDWLTEILAHLLIDFIIGYWIVVDCSWLVCWWSDWLPDPWCLSAGGCVLLWDCAVWDPGPDPSWPRNTSSNPGKASPWISMALLWKHNGRYARSSTYFLLVLLPLCLSVCLL